MPRNMKKDCDRCQKPVRQDKMKNHLLAHDTTQLRTKGGLFSARVRLDVPLAVENVPLAVVPLPVQNS